MRNFIKKLLILTCIFSLLSASVPIQAASAKKIVLNQKVLELSVGETTYLVAKTKPKKNEVTFTWKSSDDHVVWVTDRGLIIGNGIGEATVTVTAKGYKKAVCKVTVVEAPKEIPAEDSEEVKDPEKKDENPVKGIGKESEGTEFVDYDDTIMTGAEVKKVINKYQGTPFIIGVATKNIINCTKDSYVGSVPFDKLNTIKLQDINGDYIEDKAINYNALIAEPELALGFVKRTTNIFLFYGSFKAEKGTSVYNNNYDDFGAGNSASISDDKKYNSYIIKDKSAKIVGLVFVEQ